MAKSPVKILARVIPDGIEKKDTVYRVSLALMPDLRETLKDSPDVDIENWPKALQALLGSSGQPFKLYVAADPTGAPEAVNWYARGRAEHGTPGVYDGPNSLEFNAGRADLANKKWRDIFLADCGADKQFEALKDALRESQKVGKTLRVDETEASLVSYPVGLLAEAIERLYGSQTAATVLASTGQLPLNGGTGAAAAWDATRPLASAKFFEAVNAGMFGVFLPDNQTRRLSVKSYFNEQWHNNGVDTIPEIEQQVETIGEVLQTEAEPFGSGDPETVMNYASPAFAVSLFKHFREEQAHNKDVASHWSKVRASLKNAGKSAGEPIGDPPTRKRVVLDNYFQKLSTNLGAWTRGELPGLPLEPDPEAKTKIKSADDLDLEAIHKAVSAYHAAWRRDTAPHMVAASAADCATTAPIEIARRKFLNILTRPSLAKFLGLIVDVEIRAADLMAALTKLKIGTGERSYFFIMADFGGAVAHPEQRVWTATLLDRTGGIPFFGPCSSETFERVFQARASKQDTDKAQVLRYDRGILDLAVAADDKDPRFKIVDFDVDGALYALEHTAHARSSAREKGALDRDIQVAMPNLRSRGLALVDRERKREVAREITAASHFRAAEPVSLYAEDLVIGYRLDVGVCVKDSVLLPAAARWRTVTDRKVDYRDLFGKYGKWLEPDKEREDGFIKPVTREVANQKLRSPGNLRSESTTQFVAFETLAVWTGGSLAVGPGERALNENGEPEGAIQDENGKALDAGEAKKHPAKNHYPVTVVDSYCELGVNLNFSLPEAGGGGGLPPLRFDRGYWMGARLVYANGGSLNLADAAAAHYAKRDTTAVGSSKSKGFVFSRGERAAAPVILLPPDDVLVKPTPNKLFGDGFATLVLRSSSAKGRRYLVPPSSSFDLAEAHGQFDHTDAMRPKGAFTRYRRDSESGGFPSARESKSEKQGAVNPGSILDAGATSPQAAPYYPDPVARVCAIRTMLHDAPGQDDDLCFHLSFYESSTDKIEDAKPVRIRVEAFKPKAGEPLYAVRELSVPKDSPRTLLVELGEAADLDLLLWSEPDDDRELLTMRPAAFGWTALARLAPSLKARLDAAPPPSAAKAASAGILREALDFLSGPGVLESPPKRGTSTKLVQLLRERKAPVPTLMDQRRLRVVRPVMAPPPKLAPQIQLVDDPCAPKPAGGAPAKKILALAAVRVLIKEPDDWAKYVASGPANALCLASQPGASQTFFVGTAMAHRASTAKIRFEATWNEFKDEVKRHEDKAKENYGEFFYAPVPAGPAIFNVDKIARDLSQALSEVDLLNDDAGALRGLKIEFEGTRARRLQIDLYGVSRFTNFYDPTTPAKKFENHEHSVKDFWLPSTARPAPPVIDRILPVFTWRRHDDIHGTSGKIVVERHASMRIFLKRPWHDSGEGEKLAVICWPPNLFTDGTADEVARCTLLDRERPNVIDPREAFLTRWGADPIHLSGDLSDLIPADQFADAERPKRDFLLPLPRSNDPPGGQPALDIDKGCPNDPPDTRKAPEPAPPNTVKVAIAVYSPELEPHRGETWFCDLGIKPGESYFPFVRFGLARYQEHSLKDLELSYPVAEWAQIPPYREVKVELLDELNVFVVVKGIGYHQSDGSEIPDQRHLVDRPRLRIRVCRSIRPDGVRSASGNEINWLPVVVDGKPLDFKGLVPQIDGNTVIWMQKITLPRSWRKRAYALIVEEVEVMIADGSVIGKLELAERGPMFACTVPFAVPAPHGPKGQQKYTDGDDDTLPAIGVSPES